MQACLATKDLQKKENNEKITKDTYFKFKAS